MKISNAMGRTLAVLSVFFAICSVDPDVCLGSGMPKQALYRQHVQHQIQSGVGVGPVECALDAESLAVHLGVPLVLKPCHEVVTPVSHGPGVPLCQILRQSDLVETLAPRQLCEVRRDAGGDTALGSGKRVAWNGGSDPLQEQMRCQRNVILC